MSIRRNGISTVLALSLLATLTVTPSARADACKIDVDKSLWIRDLSVVEDPLRTTWVEHPTHPSQGAWTFGRLMQNMAGDTDLSTFVLELFDEFADTQHVNGFEIPPRTEMLQEIIEPWIEQSHANGFEGLDFSIAPFRLNGFVNRIDLRTNATYGTANSAGEGRIVFSVLRPEGQTALFTLILEYELIASDCAAVQDWAEKWSKLSELKFGKAYNAELEKLVNAFAGKGVAPGRPNGSAVRQVRTNELAGVFPWQWREFQLSAETGLLEQSTVAQTIQTSLNRSKLLRDYVNENEAAILAGEHVVPLEFQGQSFRGGSSDGDLDGLTAFFTAEGIQNNDARHLFSLNNCVACHTTETGTGFFHSFPRNAGQTTFLSDFLTGTTVADPVDPETERKFNDLKRRFDDLCKVLDASCDVLGTEKPLVRVH
jgi:hypothetical protein